VDCCPNAKGDFYDDTFLTHFSLKKNNFICGQRSTCRKIKKNKKIEEIPLFEFNVSNDFDKMKKCLEWIENDKIEKVKFTDVSGLDMFDLWNHLDEKKNKK
jgi:hypothetical protein